jgi:hypothetical protein
MQTPVVFIVFNRPNWATQAFEQIRAARPERLFLIADGPRPDHRDHDLIARDKCVALVETIDWPCEVSKDIADENMGCGHRIASGLSWVFAQVDKAIILEDDCIADSSFFAFCEELLQRYEHDDRVFSVAGTNYARSWDHSGASYFFSKHFHAWGWATWARAWKTFDFGISEWDQAQVRESIMRYLDDADQFNQRSTILDQIRAGRDDVWSFQWTFAHLATQGLCAVPKTNLVTNIGWGEEASHTKVFRPDMHIESGPLPSPYQAPEKVQPDNQYDRLMFDITWGKQPNRAASNAGRLSIRSVMANTRKLAGQIKRALFERP